MPAIKAVLFDLDDTLFDHRYSNQRGIVAMQPHYKSLNTRSIEVIEQDSWRIFDILWHKVISGEITVQAWLNDGFKRMFAEYEELIDDEGFVIASQHYRDSYQNSRQAVAGAVPLLEYLCDKVTVGVVTNHLAVEQHDKINWLKFGHLIDFVVCADEAGATKPDRKIFDVALGHAGCTPQEAVMVGNSWSADVIGASGMGMRAIWFNPDGNPIPNPDLAIEINSYEPLEDVAAMLLRPTD